MPTTKVDGRSDRSVRTREKIIGALFQLVGEGTLRPRAEEIAHEADVAVRTLFRHFDDMEGLITAGRDFLAIQFEPPPDQPAVEGDLEERARTFAKYQEDLFGNVRNYLLFYATQARTVEESNAVRNTTSQAHRLRVWTALPECAAANPTARQTVEALFSFHNWDQMRFEQGLSAEETADAIVWSAITLLGAGARDLGK